MSSLNSSRFEARIPWKPGAPSAVRKILNGFSVQPTIAWVKAQIVKPVFQARPEPALGVPAQPMTFRGPVDKFFLLVWLYPSFIKWSLNEACS